VAFTWPLGFDGALQVLGVLCVTVDDGPRDVVVKLNNTLKRVDAVAPAADDRRPAAVRASSAAAMWPRGGAGEPATTSGTAAAPSSTVGLGDPPPGRHAAAAADAGSSRRGHGRKQSNPVKVTTSLL